MSTDTKHGLLERIRDAESTAQVATLLAEGDCYENVHPNTRRRWYRAAKRRTAALNARDEK